MPDDVSLLQVNDGLRDAGGMIGDSLEISGRVHQLEPGVELSGVAAERFLEIAAELAILPIDQPVALDDGPRSARHRG